MTSSICGPELALELPPGDRAEVHQDVAQPAAVAGVRWMPAPAAEVVLA